jgi:hypothetical protein
MSRFITIVPVVWVMSRLPCFDPLPSFRDTFVTDAPGNENFREVG